MRIKLYIDEDAMAHRLAQELRMRGIDVTTALTQGMIECEDKEHLEYAVSQERALYSFNVGDYYKLHSQWLFEEKNHTGIILAQQQRFSTGEQLRRILRIIATVSAED